jgi:hypothetical protein
MPFTILRYDPASFQSLISPGIGSMIPGSLFSGEFTLGLIAQIRIWFCWKGLQQRLQVAVLSLAKHLTGLPRRSGPISRVACLPRLPPAPPWQKLYLLWRFEGLHLQS